MALGRLNINAHTKRGGHRLVNHQHLAATSVFRRVAHGTQLNLG